MIKKIATKALLWATEHNNAGITEFSLKVGADVNGRGRNGNTPLHFSVMSESQENVDALLRAGALPNLKDDEGIVPLHHAVVANSEEISVTLTKTLLKAGADPNIPAPHSGAPIHWAIGKGRKHIADVLLKGGCNPNIPNHYGETPLHQAAEMQDKDVLDLLLRSGANPHARENDGRTPLEYAVESVKAKTEGREPDREIVSMLERAEASSISATDKALSRHEPLRQDATPEHEDERTR